MFDIKMADLFIRVNNRFPYVHDQCKDWQAELGAQRPDLEVEASMEEIRGEQAAAQVSFSAGYCESICLYRAIAKQLHRYNAFVFHASVVSVDGQGYAFAAKSGVGKSTHTRYWLDAFGERACVVNGDKPIIRYRNGRFYAYGTPWQGKENWGTNLSVPLRGCSFLLRGNAASIRPAAQSEVIGRLFHQVLMPKEEPELSLFLHLMEQFMREVPFYLLECTLDRRSALVAYEGMTQNGTDHSA